MSISQDIKAKALELGFTACGITPADDFPEYADELLAREDYADWINGPGTGHLVDGCFPSRYFPQGRSIVCVAYGFADIDFPEELTPYIGRTYLSRSYMPLPESECGQRVEALKECLRSLGAEIYEGEFDLPARMACARAGIATYGNNNFAYTERDGSLATLYAVLTDLELDHDAPTVENRCPEGCTRCMDACPMGAIAAPGRLLPASCILRSNIRANDMTDEFVEAMGTHLHGCDECQMACPRNQAALSQLEKRRDPLLDELAREFSLERLLFMDAEYYERVVRPVMHNYIRGLDIFRRNAVIAMGNSHDPLYLPTLRRVFDTDFPAYVHAEARRAIRKLEQR